MLFAGSRSIPAFGGFLYPKPIKNHAAKLM
jgi:hypothetical protein